MASGFDLLDNLIEEKDRADQSAAPVDATPLPERAKRKVGGNISQIVNLALSGLGLSSNLEGSISSAIANAMASEDPETRESQLRAIDESTGNPTSLDVPDPSVGVSPAVTVPEKAIDFAAQLTGDAALAVANPAAAVLRPIGRQAIKQGGGVAARALLGKGADAGARQLAGGAAELAAGEATGVLAGAVGGEAVGDIVNAGTQLAVSGGRSIRQGVRRKATNRALESDLPLVEGRGEARSIGTIDERLPGVREDIPFKRTRQSLRGDAERIESFGSSVSDQANRNVISIESDIRSRANALAKSTGRSASEVSVRASLESTVARRDVEAQKLIEPIDEDEILQASTGVEALSTNAALDELEGRLGVLPSDPKKTAILRTEGSESPIKLLREVLTEVDPDGVLQAREAMSFIQLQGLRSDLARVSRSLPEDPGGKGEIVESLLEAATKDMRFAAADRGPEFLERFDGFNVQWRGTRELEKNRLFKRIVNKKGDEASPILQRSTSAEEVLGLRDELGGIGSDDWQNVQAGALSEILSKPPSERRRELATRLAGRFKIDDDKLSVLFDTEDPRDLLAIRQNIAQLKREAQFVEYSGRELSIRKIIVKFPEFFEASQFFKIRGVARRLTRLADAPNSQQQARMIASLQRDVRRAGVAIRIVDSTDPVEKLEKILGRSPVNSRGGVRSGPAEQRTATPPGAGGFPSVPPPTDFDQAANVERSLGSAFR